LFVFPAIAPSARAFSTTCRWREIALCSVSQDIQVIMEGVPDLLYFERRRHAESDTADGNAADQMSGKEKCRRSFAEPYMASAGRARRRSDASSPPER
jgi:hypothetical protein